MNNSEEEIRHYKLIICPGLQKAGAIAYPGVAVR